jgi:Lrp/AsnC family transcriptional regulator, leucine-responsive regulatory protein
LADYFAMRAFSLDQIDRLILEILQGDCRISNQKLADAVGLTPSPCLRRLRALERSGAIVGYTAIIAPQALGLTLAAFAQVSLAKGDPEIDRKFLAALQTIEAVSGWYACAGDYDYLLKIVVSNHDSYLNALIQLRRAAGVETVKAGIVVDPQPGIFAFYRLSYAPFHPAELSALVANTKSDMSSLDTFDRKIIASLQRDARISILDLSREIALSPPATLQRLRKLERNKVVLGYTAVVQPAAIGMNLVALIAVTLKRGGDGQSFEQAVTARPEVAACFAVAGDVDYEIRVTLPNIESYTSLLKNFLRRIPEVDQIHSSLCISPPPHLFSHYKKIKDPLLAHDTSHFER